MARARGGALLVVVALLLVATAALFGHLEGAAARAAREREAVTARALATAREALIGYALRDTTRPGELPCPDYNGDGVIRIAGAERDYSGGACRTELEPGVVRPGRLPWRTLGLPELRDGAGEPLWYVVSDRFHAGAADTLNSDSPGAMSLGGEGDVVALLIAPGLPLEGQGGRPAVGFDALRDAPLYLEGENRDGDLAYGVAEGNDRLLALTRERLMAAVERRVVGEAAGLLEGYFAACGVYPHAAPFTSPDLAEYRSEPGRREGLLPLAEALPDGWGAPCPGGTAPTPPAYLSYWRGLLRYAFADPCVAGVDCLTLSDGGAPRDDLRLVTLLAGRDLIGRRPSDRLDDYFEGENATADDGRFERRAISGGFNDRVVVR